MIDLNGARGLGFLSTVNGGNAELRETILQNLGGVNQTITTQTGVNQSYANQLNSVSSAIENYYSSWNLAVSNAISISAGYAAWWAAHGRAMQDLMNQYLDSLRRMDEILTSKGK